MPDRLILDLFAGPGGWSQGLRTLGLPDVGIEQIGNAVPPPLAAAVLSVLVDLPAHDRLAVAV